MANATLEQARAAKAIARDRLAGLGVSGIVGIGITRVENSYAVKVNLQSHPPADIALPSAIDGVPLQIEITGRPRAQATA